MNEEAKKELISKLTNICLGMFFLGAVIGFVLGKIL